MKRRAIRQENTSLSTDKADGYQEASMVAGCHKKQQNRSVNNSKHSLEESDGEHELLENEDSKIFDNDLVLNRKNHLSSRFF